MRCSCPSSTWSVNMENKCNTCFYALMDKDLEAPCAGCTGYSNYVKGDVYMTKPYTAKPLKEAIDDWFSNTNGVETEDFWVSYKGITHDPVEKPKHYMLFEEEGIEVRDVLKKLVTKMEMHSSGMFIADYVQMMQYLMRFMDKNGVEDLKKARWYLDKLIDSYESDF
jgi:hypothetical protein